MDAEYKEKLKQMTPKQRLGYFWDYHKWKIIIPLLVLIFLVTFITDTIEEKKPAALLVAVVNASDISDMMMAITQEYPQDRGIDTKKTPVRMEADFLHPQVMGEAATMDNRTIASIQKYNAMVINAYIDITISPTWAVDEYQKANVYEDLQQLLPEEFLKEHEDLLYYAKNADGNNVVTGIRLDETELFGNLYKDSIPIMTICTYSKRQDEAIQFMKWIIEKDSK